MALTDPKDTLAFHQSRVLTQHRDMSEVPCLLVAKAMQKFKNADEHKDTVPEAEALWFYGMNHGMALISAARAPLEPLPPDELNFVEAYHHALAPKAIRAFYYLLWICTREARHNQSLQGRRPQDHANFGAQVCNFLTVHQRRREGDRPGVPLQAAGRADRHLRQGAGLDVLQFEMVIELRRQEVGGGHRLPCALRHRRIYR